MTSDIEFADGVVRAILVALNGHDRHWRVLDAHYHRGQAINDEPPAGVDEIVAGEARPTTVLVRIAADDEVVGAHVVVALDRQRAIAAVADQLQDQVVEASQGQVVPPCPGHPHPLQALEVDGVASWVCPKDPKYHQEPIVSDPGPG